MSSINVLSREISELIAAGEVIERPASVIKELVENSIDAGAKHITVEIKNGGITYMRVTDDGIGMSFEDVPKAFLRHATSKIFTKNDLDNISTLGFRGEALSSIEAVGRVELMTKQNGDTYGTIYSISGGEQLSYDKSGCPDGTTIVIRDLFYNIPARLKFMKKDVTEANAVSNIVQKITLSHPEIAFKMIRDNRIEFNSAGDGELYSAVYAVYGKDFARDLIPVDYEYNGIRVSGYSVKPLYSKSNRSFQNFFVNGRYIRSRLCSSALENAYENMIVTGKFPTCVLMIDMSPQEMDVNIHPSKAEVRFTDEKRLTDAVYFAIKNALVGSGLLYEFELKSKPEYKTESVEPAEPAEKKPEPVQQEILFSPEEIPHMEESTVIPEKQEFSAPIIADIADNVETVAEKSVEPIPETVSDSFRYITPENFEKPAPKTTVPRETIIPEEKKPDVRIIGEAFGLYILAEYDGKIIMVDKHAAHERIIFERLRSRNCRQYSQILLTGIKILLTSEEIDVMENNTELLADLGFEFDFSERPCITATAVPTFIMEADIEGIISEVAENLRLHKQNPQTEYLDNIFHTMACKSAIKANDKNSPEEMKALVEQILADENIRHCPHGRPVMFTMTKSNIDHQFKRT
ncbi:MAG: DNA mismatch repair endonuclease MutL [Ruminococcus flavefaciens]|nr:DNA mismatch repair endonuclease MutL [Ruminococcus flavefaciens]MCM1229510.1 DNA mismatch repair endonuclease MutL [Ruminococcus flavefaciens]